MATYKVPQDVEADDKLLGPFTFRQFVYLMLVFGLLLLAVALFQIFPLLAIIPIPFMIFFAILALPIKKDQPMETYLAAVISYHTKANKRYWTPGLSESTILITAPKKTEPKRKRNITEDEASHRLSFLSEIVDSEGHAIKNANTTMKDDFYAEAYNTTDMFDRDSNFGFGNRIAEQEQEKRNEIVDQMRSAIAKSEFNYDNTNQNSDVQVAGQRVLQPTANFTTGGAMANAGDNSSAVVQPIVSVPANPTTPVTPPAPNQPPAPVNSSGETIEQEADRIRKENESEVYVSLH